MHNGDVPIKIVMMSLISLASGVQMSEDSDDSDRRFLNIVHGNAFVRMTVIKLQGVSHSPTVDLGHNVVDQQTTDSRLKMGMAQSWLTIQARGQHVSSFLVRCDAL